jgi:Ca-activated chloride channel family protein
VKDAAPSDSSDIRFAAAVAAFGMLLRDSEHKGTATYEGVLELARAGQGQDPGGYRSEFLQLVETAQSLTPRTARIGG